MGRITLIITAAALVFGAAGSAAIPAPVPVETRAEAILELTAAIEDEQRALELLRKDPPRRDTASIHLGKALGRLGGIKGFLSKAPGAQAGESAVDQAWHADLRARDATWRLEEENAITLIEEGLAKKRAALPLVRAAQPPPAVAQCSDGKDNDRDGLMDWDVESGCTSARDVRESSPFSCGVDSQTAGGRLEVAGSCSGAFSEVEFELLDGLQLNGRFDISHAPSCSPPTTTVVRCQTKTGAQNPGHLIHARFTTTARTPGQRLRVRLFDRKKRRVANLVLLTR